MLLITIIIVYIIIALVLVIGLLLNGVRPSKTLAWLLAIFTIPIGGVLLYLLLGRNRRKNKLFNQKNIHLDDTSSEINQMLAVNDPSSLKTIKLINKTSSYPLTYQNQVRILKDGKETFESIFSTLENAKHHIHIQYYIYEDGMLADKLLQLFKKKVQEGVKIRLLFDGIGSYSLSKKHIKDLQNIGVGVHQFLPFRFGRFLSSINYRNHRKILVVDGEVGFTGGINISDKYITGDDALGNWHDIHSKIQGKAAGYLDRIFVTDWYLAGGEKVEFSQHSIATPTEQNGMEVQIVPSGPDDDFATMEQVYFSIINNAKKYLYIINPYIIPNHAILQSLQTAALSGIDVRILMSSSTDMKVVDWCVRAYFESYLKAGIKLYLYPDGFLHSKVVISDDQIVSVGTANLDDRSLQQNYEVNAIIYNNELCRNMKEDFLQDCSKSVLLDLETHQKRPWRIKVLEGSAKLLSPLL
jgi:cardiolipin synthase